MTEPTPRSDLALTYCGNVHPATDVDAFLASTERFAVPVAAARRAAGWDFGLGSWWNAATARALRRNPAERARVADFLRSRDLRVWTMNVFPFGAFHDARVKTDVYRPDWSSEARRDYTLDVAEVVAGLAAEGLARDEVPMSTLPLGYGDLDEAACVVHLRAVARALGEIEASQGVALILALEPEPFCRLETVAATAEFLEERVFAGSGAEEPILRRHLGVCIDLCHLAVVGEDPVAAMAALATQGIRVPKIQVSACLELRDPAGLEELLAFDEPVYLHQTVGADGSRALDLGEVAARREVFAAAGILRTHFHMPVFWNPEGALGSTQAQLVAALRALPRPLPLLEVETYTWGVLPGWDTGDARLRAGLLDELEFVASILEGGGDAPANSPDGD